MSEIRIQYVQKTDHHHEHITELGNDFGWSPVAWVVASIKSGAHIFYTFENGRKALLHVQRSPTTGREYVQTFGDGVWQNNLLNLPARRAA